MSAKVGSEHRIYARRGITLEHVGDVPVGIHRQADLAMAEDLHDDAWVDSLCDQQRGAGVTQAVAQAVVDTVLAVVITVGTFRVMGVPVAVPR